MISITINTSEQLRIRSFSRLLTGILYVQISFVILNWINRVQMNIAFLPKFLLSNYSRIVQ